MALILVVLHLSIWGNHLMPQVDFSQDRTQVGFSVNLF